MALAADHARRLGAASSYTGKRPIRQCARSALRARDADRERILLLGHLDTVWPMGTIKTMPWRMGDGRLCGPGVLDMKAGVAMAFIAIELLAEAQH